MTEVTDWSAARSGAAITITARTAEGAEIKLTDVRLLQPDLERAGDVVATTKSGDVHRLSFR